MDEYHCVVSVVGYVSHGNTFSSSKNGVGKSCLCCRFTHPNVDDYIDDHPSLLALHELESNVVCTDSFLYWGPREVEFSSANKGKGARVKMEVVEHTLFYYDETSSVFPRFKKLQDVDCYAKQALAPPESSRKISYYSRDYIGFPDRYRCLPYLSNVNRISRGFVVVVDVSIKMPRFEEHLTAAQQIVHRLSKDSKQPFIIAATKRDCADPVSLQRLVDWASKKKITIVETSAKENVNVRGVFSHIASKILKNARISDSVLSYSGAIGVSLEESTKAKTQFKNYLKKTIKTSNGTLSSIENSFDYVRNVELFGKFGADEVYARHLLEVRDQEIRGYPGVMDNPDMRMEMLEQFIDEIMPDLVAHKRTLRSMINTLVSPDDNLYANEGPSSSSCSPEKPPLTSYKPPKGLPPPPAPPLAPATDDVYDSIDELTYPIAKRCNKVEIEFMSEKKEPLTVSKEESQIEEYYDRFESSSSVNDAGQSTTVPSDGDVSNLPVPDRSKLLKRQSPKSPYSPLPFIKPFDTQSDSSSAESAGLTPPLFQKLKQDETLDTTKPSSKLTSQVAVAVSENPEDLSELSISERAKVLNRQLMGSAASSDSIHLKQHNDPNDSSCNDSNEIGNKYGFFTPTKSMEMETKQKPLHKKSPPPPPPKKPPKKSYEAVEEVRSSPKTIPNTERRVSPALQQSPLTTNLPERYLDPTAQQHKREIIIPFQSLEKPSSPHFSLKSEGDKETISENPKSTTRSSSPKPKPKPVPPKKPSNYHKVVINLGTSSEQLPLPLPQEGTDGHKKIVPPPSPQNDSEEDIYISSSVEDPVTPHQQSSPQPCIRKTDYPSPKTSVRSATQEILPKSSSCEEAILTDKDRLLTVSSALQSRPPPQYDQTCPPLLRENRKTVSGDSKTSGEYKPRLDALRKKIELEKVNTVTSQPYSPSSSLPPSTSTSPPSYPAPSLPATPPLQPKIETAPALEGTLGLQFTTSNNNVVQLSHSRSMDIEKVVGKPCSDRRPLDYSTQTLPHRRQDVMKEGTPPPPLPLRTDEMTEFVSNEQAVHDHSRQFVPNSNLQTEIRSRSRTTIAASSVPSSPKKRAPSKGRKNYFDTVLKLLTNRDDGEEKRRDEPQSREEVPKPRFVKMRGRPLPPEPGPVFDEVPEHSEEDYEPVNHRTASTRPPCPPPHHTLSPLSPNMAHQYLPALVSPPSPLFYHQVGGVPVSPILMSPSQHTQLLMMQSLGGHHQISWDHANLRKPQRSKSMNYRIAHYNDGQTDGDGYEITDDWISRGSRFASPPFHPQREYYSEEYDYPDVRRGVRKPASRMCPPRSASTSPRKPKPRAVTPPSDQDGDDYVNMQGDLIDDDDYENAEVIKQMRVGRSLDDSHISPARKVSRHGSMDDINIYYNLQNRESQLKFQEHSLPPRETTDKLPTKSNFSPKPVDLIPRRHDDDIDEETGQTHTSSESEIVQEKVKRLPPRNVPRPNYTPTTGEGYLKLEN